MRQIALVSETQTFVYCESVCTAVVHALLIILLWDHLISHH